MQTEETYAYYNDEVNMIAPTRAHHNQAFIRWIAPFQDWYVLNTDGATKGAPGIARGGGVLRGWRRGFIRAFSSSFGICKTYRAKLMAVSIGLDMARDLGIQKLEIKWRIKLAFKSSLIQNIKEENVVVSNRVLMMRWDLMRLDFDATGIPFPSDQNVLH
ncbi:hypothetical protein RDABS01_032299 [Bienertia sinuspersici]